MKIKYVWFDNPDKEKMHDTINGYREHLKMCNFLKQKPMSKQEWDEYETKVIEDKHKAGYVLRYEIIQEA